MTHIDWTSASIEVSAMKTTRTNVIPLLPADYREAVMLQHAREALAAVRGVFH